jgi:hypothetical protein
LPPRPRRWTVLETLQIQGQEGPCVDAYRSGRQVAVPDLRRTARRWPVFTPVIGRDLYDGYRGRLKPEPTTGTDQIPVSQPRPLEPGEQPRDVTATGHR